MSNQKLGVLAAVAAAMVLLAVVQARLSVGGRSGQSGPAYLIQGLDPAAIGSITVGEGNDAVKIERQGSQFVVVNEADYPADTKQINDLITKSLDIKTSGVYTDNPKNHEDLEVTEAKARHVVKFFKPDGSLLTGVVIGKSQESGQDTFVRLASDDKVYVAENVPWFRNRGLDYVNQEIASVKREDVNAVTVITPEGTYTLKSKAEGDGVVMEGLPTGEKLKESDAKSVLTAMVGLRFDDVNKPAQIGGLMFDHEYVCRLDNSTEYRLKLAKKGEKTYLIGKAVYTDPTKVTINTGQVDSPEELKKKEAILLAQEHAQRFTLRHKGWVYEIPDWKAKYLMKKQAELFEEKEEPAEVKAETPAPAQDVTVPAVTPAPATVTPSPAREPAPPITVTPPPAEANEPAQVAPPEPNHPQ
jgi:hypothetical protein